MPAGAGSAAGGGGGGSGGSFLGGAGALAGDSETQTRYVYVRLAEAMNLIDRRNGKTDPYCALRMVMEYEIEEDDTAPSESAASEKKLSAKAQRLAIDDKIAAIKAEREAAAKAGKSVPIVAPAARRRTSALPTPQAMARGSLRAGVDAEATSTASPVVSPKPRRRGSIVAPATSKGSDGASGGGDGDGDKSSTAGGSDKRSPDRGSLLGTAAATKRRSSIVVPNSASSAMAQKRNSRRVSISLQQAQHLQKVTAGDDVSGIKSSIVKHSVNPVWNEDFVLPLATSAQDLQVDVFDWNRLTRSTFLGRVLVPMHLLSDEQPELCGWFYLDERTKKKKMGVGAQKKSGVRMLGQVLLHLSLVPLDAHERLPTRHGKCAVSRRLFRGRHHVSSVPTFSLDVRDAVTFTPDRASALRMTQEDADPLAGVDVKDPKYNLLDMLRRPLGPAAFTAHLKKEFSEENIQFYIAVKAYKAMRVPGDDDDDDDVDNGDDDATKQRKRAECKQAAIAAVYECAQRTAKAFIGAQSDSEVNIDSKQAAIVLAAVQLPSAAEFDAQLPNHGLNLFDDAYEEVLRLMARDSFKRFCASPAYAAVMAPSTYAAGPDYAGQSERVRIFCGTWNVGNARPQSNISKWIPHTDSFHLVVIGGQEVSYPDVRADLYGKPVAHSCEADWFSFLARYLGAQYVLVASTSLREMRVCVFVLVAHAHKISNVRCGTKATGLGGVVGNKGGTAISLSYNSTSFCFINCHLAAHQEKVSDRIDDTKNILTKLHMMSGAADKQETNPLHGELDVTHCYDHVLFFGDLNYRLDYGAQGNNRSPSEQQFHTMTRLIEQNQLSQLAKYDQLRACMRGNLVLTGYEEGDITKHKPTFKVRPQYRGYAYDSKRSPAWCDRVLWHSRPGLRLRQTHLGAAGSIASSDHKPVFAAFTTRSHRMEARTDDSRGACRIVVEHLEACWDDVMANAATDIKTAAKAWTVKFGGAVLATGVDGNKTTEVARGSRGGHSRSHSRSGSLIGGGSTGSSNSGSSSTSNDDASTLLGGDGHAGGMIGDGTMAQPTGANLYVWPTQRLPALALNANNWRRLQHEYVTLEIYDGDKSVGGGVVGLFAIDWSKLQATPTTQPCTIPMSFECAVSKGSALVVRMYGVLSIEWVAAADVLDVECAKKSASSDSSGGDASATASGGGGVGRSSRRNSLRGAAALVGIGTSKPATSTKTAAPSFPAKDESERKRVLMLVEQLPGLRGETPMLLSGDGADAGGSSGGVASNRRCPSGPMQAKFKRQTGSKRLPMGAVTRSSSSESDDDDDDDKNVGAQSNGGDDHGDGDDTHDADGDIFAAEPPTVKRGSLVSGDGSSSGGVSGGFDGFDRYKPETSLVMEETEYVSDDDDDDGNCGETGVAEAAPKPPARHHQRSATFTSMSSSPSDYGFTSSPPATAKQPSAQQLSKLERLLGTTNLPKRGSLIGGTVSENNNDSDTNVNDDDDDDDDDDNNGFKPEVSLIAEEPSDFEDSTLSIDVGPIVAVATPARPPPSPPKMIQSAPRPPPPVPSRSNAAVAPPVAPPRLPSSRKMSAVPTPAAPPPKHARSVTMSTPIKPPRPPPSLPLSSSNQSGHSKSMSAEPPQPPPRSQPSPPPPPRSQPSPPPPPRSQPSPPPPSSPPKPPERPTDVKASANKAADVRPTTVSPSSSPKPFCTECGCKGTGSAFCKECGHKM